MLTKGDDYPIHQTPEPIAYPDTSDRNFYDRYFFNGYSWDGEYYFTTALGVYPALNIIDAAFCIVHKGVQHNVHASRYLNMERLDLKVGPIELQIVEPLQSLRIVVDDEENGIRADVTFHGQNVPHTEPRFTTRNGARIIQDYTRFTQNGNYEGWIEVQGERIEVTRDNFVGTRDRSWGIRPVGESDPQPMVPAFEPQIFWIWAPLNFEDRSLLFHISENAEGEAWNQSAMVALNDGTPPTKIDSWQYEVEYKSGSRHFEGTTISFENKEGERTTIDFDIKYNYYQIGNGYFNPDWKHGGNKGELAVGYDTINLADIDTSDYPYRHIQAFAIVTMTLPDGQVRKGAGIVEQLIIGPHKPSGFNNDREVAPCKRSLI